MTDDEEFLISYANLKSNLFTYQSDFLGPKDLEFFLKHPYMGMPICLPSGIKFFDYSKAIFFKIDKIRFSQKIFKTNKINYIGNKKFFRYGNTFATNVSLKKKYLNKYKFYISNIRSLRKKISLLKKNYKRVCSMQIRNAPHYGHEAVFRKILEKFDMLVLNPIFGIKKKNDFSDNVIQQSLKYMEQKYDNLIFLPVWSNFYYAGPREAMHHLLIRQNLGFDYFYIGRDHAGAENLYKPNDASDLAAKYKKKFKIKFITSRGGYLCKTCNFYVIKGSCDHKNLVNISGTEFRFFLKRKMFYKHADIKLQKKIYNFI
jgi:sulfate adenylyltransferase